MVFVCAAAQKRATAECVLKQFKQIFIELHVLQFNTNTHTVYTREIPRSRYCIWQKGCRHSAEFIANCYGSWNRLLAVCCSLSVVVVPSCQYQFQQIDLICSFNAVKSKHKRCMLLDVSGWRNLFRIKSNSSNNNQIHFKIFNFIFSSVRSSLLAYLHAVLCIDLQSPTPKTDWCVSIHSMFSYSDRCKKGSSHYRQMMNIVDLHVYVALAKLKLKLRG